VVRHKRYNSSLSLGSSQPQDLQLRRVGHWQWQGDDGAVHFFSGVQLGSGGHHWAWVAEDV
jgi:hypothetical protein